MNIPIYLDYAATTPVDPRVAAKMMQYLTHEGIFANPSSAHPLGLKAREAVEFAREQVAKLIHAQPEEIVWTSGATEANNLALKGAAQLYQSKGKHIVTMKTEHPAVLDCCQQLEKQGFQVTYLSPEKNGLLDLQKFQDALRNDTILVSIMHVNNEIGIIQDIQSIAAIASQRNILFHVDAAQSVGKLPIHLDTLPVDLMSFSAHKIYGPKGIGALYVRRKPRVRVAAQIHGGGQEQGMRSGTLATHQIVGIGSAFEIAREEIKQDYVHVKKLKDYFIDNLKHIFENAHFKINGDIDHSIPNILSISFTGMSAADFINRVPELAVSAGSACLSKGVEPSYVLRALGQSETEAKCAVRFSFGRFTTQAEIDFALEKIRASLINQA